RPRQRQAHPLAQRLVAVTLVRRLLRDFVVDLCSVDCGHGYADLHRFLRGGDRAVHCQALVGAKVSGTLDVSYDLAGCFADLFGDLALQVCAGDGDLTTGRRTGSEEQGGPEERSATTHTTILLYFPRPVDRSANRDIRSAARASLAYMRPCRWETHTDTVSGIPQRGRPDERGYR